MFLKHRLSRNTMVEKETEICLKDGVDKEKFCQSTLNFQEYLKNSLENILNNVTEESFIRIYKTSYQVFQKREDVIRPSLGGSSAEAKLYRKQLNAILSETVSESIYDTLLGLDQKLRDLDELKKEQAGNHVIWRPPGNASQHMIPFEYVCLIEMKKELERKIEREQEAINTLRPRVVQKRLQAQKLHGELLSLTDEIKRTVTEQVDN